VITGTLPVGLGNAELAAGLRFGLAASAIGLVAALARPAARPLPISGLLFMAAFVAGLAATAGPGPAPDRWRQALVVSLLVPCGWLMADFDARWRGRGLGPVLLAISVTGVYATVPDTEQALVALGAALPLALLGWPWPLTSLGPVGAYLATGVLLWVAATGGAPRGSAMVGGAACLGLLVVEPLARMLDPARQSVLEHLPEGGVGVALACLPHLALVAVAARVAGLQPTAARAAAVVLAELVAAVLLALGVTRAARRARR
jgi:hypothetical protein